MAQQNDNRMFISKGAFVSGNNLWLLTETTDILLCFDITTMKLEKYFLVPGDDLKQYAHMAMIQGEKGIYILPFRGEGLYLCDDSEKMKQLPMPYEKSHQELDDFLICGSWKGNMAFVGHGVQGIFFYDEASGIIEKQLDYINDIKQAGYDVSKPLFSDASCQVGSSLYVPIYRTNAILKIDLQKKSHELYQLDDVENLRLRTIDIFESDGEYKFFLTTCDGDSLVWSQNKGVEDYRKLNLLQGNDRIYHRAYKINEKKYYIAAWERKIFIEKGQDISKLEFDYELNGAVSELDHTQFEALFKSGNHIYFQARSNGQLFKIDTDRDVITRLDFCVSEKEKKKMIHDICKNRKTMGFMKESSVEDIEIFLGVTGNMESRNLHEASSADFGRGRSADRWRFLLYS